MEPQVAVHFAAGLLGIGSGAVALIAPKGSRPHRIAGTVFVLTMIAAAGSGAGFGIWKGRFSDAVAGILTVYLIATGWLAARRPPGAAGLPEWGGFLFAGAMAAVAWWTAIAAVQSGDALLGGVPYVIFAGIITLAALADLSVLARKGLSGRQRIARHLWRLHLGFAAAVGSFFPGQIDFFPKAVREFEPIIVLFIPVFTVLGLMAFWLVRVLVTGRYGTARPRKA
jgi:uncharacterized membrane protein